MTVTWTGTKEFSTWLRETPGIVTKDVKAALYQEGSGIMGASKKRTPVDTGRLRASGHAKLPTEKRNSVTVVLAYGTEYAIFVHERPANHTVGQMKYLESAVREAAPEFVASIGARLKHSMERRS